MEVSSVRWKNAHTSNCMLSEALLDLGNFPSLYPLLSLGSHAVVSIRLGNLVKLVNDDLFEA